MTVEALDPLPNNRSCAMYALSALGRKDEAKAFMDKVIANDSINPGNYYTAACLYSLMGDTNKSLSYLWKAFEKGYHRFHHVMIDDDLEELRQTGGFTRLIEEFRGNVLEDRSERSDYPTETVP